MQRMDRLLIVDDDVELCALVKKYLEAEGFRIEEAYDGEKGIVRSLSGEHVLIILDLMLPGLSGIEVLRRLRMESPIPVLMLTARDQQVDKIVGLEVGADDYLAKPFDPRELVARIRAILRRTGQVSPASIPLPTHPPLNVGDLVLDKNTRKVQRAGETVEVTALEFSLLEVLMRSAGRVVTREELAKIVLVRVFDPFDRSIDMHVSNLRKKLSHGSNGSEWIKTIRGAGYLLVRRDLRSNPASAILSWLSAASLTQGEEHVAPPEPGSSTGSETALMNDEDGPDLKYSDSIAAARTMLALKGDAAALQRRLPSGWELAPYDGDDLRGTSLKGANMLVPFHEVYAVTTRDNQTAGLPQVSYVAFASQARNQATGALAHVHWFTYTEDPAAVPGTYRDGKLAHIKRLQTFTKEHRGETQVREIFSAVADSGEIHLSLAYEQGGMMIWATADKPNLPLHAAKNPNILRVYQEDQVINVVRSEPLGVDRVSEISFSVKGELADVFDGNEHIIAVVIQRPYMRQVYVP
jgi:DNA-binding response OmpR family regulator